MKPRVFLADVAAVWVVVVVVLVVTLMGTVDSASVVHGNGQGRLPGRHSRSATATDEGEWSTWINSDSPLTGDGDFESVDTIKAAYTICTETADSILRAQCRVAGTNLSLDSTSGATGDDHLLQPCSVQGLVCLNRQQLLGRCQDYEVRFLCKGGKDKDGRDDGGLFPDFDFKIYVILAVVPLTIVLIRLLWSCCCRYRCQHQGRTSSRSARPRISRLSASSSRTSFDASLALPPPSYTDLFGSTAIFSPGPVAPGPGKAFAVFSITDGQMGGGDCCCRCYCPRCSSDHQGCQHFGPPPPQVNSGGASNFPTGLTSAHEVFTCIGWNGPRCPCLTEARGSGGLAACTCAGERSDVELSAVREASSSGRREGRRRSALFLRSLSFPTFHALAEVTSEEESDDVFVPAVLTPAAAAPPAGASGSPGHTPRLPRRFSTTAVMSGGQQQTLVRNGSDTALLLYSVMEPPASRGSKSVTCALTPRQEEPKLQRRLRHRRSRSATSSAESRLHSGCAPCAISSSGGGDSAASRAAAHACACPCHHLHLAVANPAFQWETETQSPDGHVARGSRLNLPGMHRPVLGLPTSGSLTSFASCVTEPPDYEEALEILNKGGSKIAV